MTKETLTKQPSTWPAVIWEVLKSLKTRWIFFAITTLLLLLQLSGLDLIGTVRQRITGKKSEPNIETNKPEPKTDKDPLGIEGTWTYTTFFNNDDDSRKHKYKAVQGINFLIKFDGCSYIMQGQRTHYEEKNSNTFQKYPNPIPIKISRTGLTSDSTSFYFYFEVQGTEKVDQSEGFVELQIDKSNKSKMEGVVHYLHSDGTWSKSHITFEKQ